jgi:pyridoxine kinase
VDLNILSIQSSVAFGHVGNSAAVFPLQRLGVEVWPVNTVHFSNHTGYGSWRGSVLSFETVSDILRGIEERGAFPLCDGVLSGYMGEAALGEVILQALRKIRQANPNVHYCCDPVMGDVGRGFFVRPGIPEFMKVHAVPAATIITPNQFELEYLSGQTVTDRESAVQAANKVRLTGPKIVLVTSLRRNDAPDNQIELLAVDEHEAMSVSTPLLPLTVNGAGDMTAALFFARWLQNESIQEALELTAASVFAVLKATLKSGSSEIQLIAAQDTIAKPRRLFKAKRI